MTITLSPEMETFVNEKINGGSYASPVAVVDAGLRVLHNQEAAPNPEKNGASPDYVRPTSPPDWVLALKPRNPANDGTNGLHRVLGKWPGGETEEELLILENRLDDEDAGRR